MKEATKVLKVLKISRRHLIPRKMGGGFPEKEAMCVINLRNDVVGLKR